MSALQTSGGSADPTPLRNSISPVVQFPKFYKKKKRKKTTTAPKDWIGSCGPDENATVAENSRRVPLSPNQSAVFIILTASRPSIKAE
jgi:hypothetical protein